MAALLSTLVVTTSVTVVLVPRPAAADPIAGLKAQATAISQSLVQEQLQAGAYQLQYSVASQKVAADALAIGQIGQQIILNEQQIDKDTRAVRQLALVSYMNGGSSLSDADSLLFSGSESGQAADEYSVIAAGNIEGALDQLHSAQHTLQAHEATLQQEQTQDQSAQNQQATDLAQAQGTQHQIEFVQSQITSQLAAAIAQQAVQQAANAAAAVAAAQKAALAAAQKAALGAAQKPVTTGSPTGVPPTSTATADPALNPFLQCVVQAESRGNYGAVSPDGMYMGAFQFSQGTWNMAAQAAGLSALVGVPPNLASKAEQDAVAVALYALDGNRPWLGDRC